MITLNNVNKAYGNKKVVDNINAEIEQGKITGFLGPNGAGKTTTIKMMTGILKPDTGSILINEKDIIKSSIDAKKEFGYVPDSAGVFLRLKGIEYLNFIAEIYNVPAKERNRIIEELTEKFEMKKVLNNTIHSYSHGMRQKLVITGSLLHDPNVWILDEPLTGLDPQAAFILKDIMNEYAKRGKTVFFSTHILEVAERICDKLIVINKGKILFNGEKNQMQTSLKNDSSLEKMFLELTSNV